MTPDRDGPHRARTLADLVADAVRGDSGGMRHRAAALAAMVPMLAASARSAGVRAVAAGRWLSDVVTELAPHVSFRDRAELRRIYPHLSDAEVAERLVTSAARLTAAIGAGAGALATAEFAAPPSLLAAPIQLAAETVAVVAVELRLVAELHEITGFALAGTLRETAPGYLNSWVRRRAADPAVGFAMADILGSATKRELRVRLLRRMGRSTTSLAPFLAGAAAGAEVNRRSTKDLGARLLAELRGMSRPAADITVTRADQARVIASIEPGSASDADRAGR